MSFLGKCSGISGFDFSQMEGSLKEIHDEPPFGKRRRGEIGDIAHTVLSSPHECTPKRRVGNRSFSQPSIIAKRLDNSRMKHGLKRALSLPFFGKRRREDDASCEVAQELSPKRQVKDPSFATTDLIANLFDNARIEAAFHPLSFGKRRRSAAEGAYNAMYEWLPKRQIKDPSFLDESLLNEALLEESSYATFDVDNALQRVSEIEQKVRSLSVAHLDFQNVLLSLITKVKSLDREKYPALFCVEVVLVDSFFNKDRLQIALSSLLPFKKVLQAQSLLLSLFAAGLIAKIDLQNNVKFYECIVAPKRELASLYFSLVQSNSLEQDRPLLLDEAEQFVKHFPEIYAANPRIACYLARMSWFSYPGEILQSILGNPLHKPFIPLFVCTFLSCKEVEYHWRRKLYESIATLDERIQISFDQKQELIENLHVLLDSDPYLVEEVIKRCMNQDPKECMLILDQNKKLMEDPRFWAVFQRLSLQG